MLFVLAHVLRSREDCRIQAFNDGKDHCIVVVGVLQNPSGNDMI